MSEVLVRKYSAVELQQMSEFDLEMLKDTLSSALHFIMKKLGYVGWRFHRSPDGSIEIWGAKP